MHETDVEDDVLPYDTLTQRLLAVRGITTISDAERFLRPEYKETLHSPFLLTDMEKAVERILTAYTEKEHIAIYSDYDCDGIPGGVLLHDFFSSIGHTHFINHIPHRHYDGYGFNPGSIDTFMEKNVSLVITVDCGITDHAAVERANVAGIDVIVTDHHEPSETLPPAYAVINPKRDSAYPFSGICGTAVAYKLVQAVLARGRERGIITLKEGMEKWWLDLVGIATIADMVPLVDENRTLARYGLSVLRKSRRPGIQHLLRVAGTRQTHITEDDIGFTIAPRVNAASRMDTPEDAFHMLRTNDEGEAGAVVAHLEKLNTSRKAAVAVMTKEAKKRLALLPEVPSVIVMGNPEWRPSLVGLVANSLAEVYRRPAFLWGRDGMGIIKGSCRSDGEVSVVRLMEFAQTAFRTFGGHHASGGFSVDDDAIHELPAHLVTAYEHHRGDAVVPPVPLHIDGDITLQDISPTLLQTIQTFAPFGVGNPRPLFRLCSVIPDDVVVFGKTKNHTKIRLRRDRGYLDAIAFFKLPTEFAVSLVPGKPVHLIGHIEQSFFMGRNEIRMRLVDVEEV